MVLRLKHRYLNTFVFKLTRGPGKFTKLPSHSFFPEYATWNKTVPLCYLNIYKNCFMQLKKNLSQFYSKIHNPTEQKLKSSWFISQCSMLVHNENLVPLFSTKVFKHSAFFQKIGSLYVERFIVTQQTSIFKDEISSEGVYTSLSGKNCCFSPSEANFWKNTLFFNFLVPQEDTEGTLGHFELFVIVTTRIQLKTLEIKPLSILSKTLFTQIHFLKFFSRMLLTPTVSLKIQLLLLEVAEA